MELSVSKMQVKTPEYQSHNVFEQLERCIDFYRSLSHSVFLWMSPGIKGALGNIDSYVFSSMEGTLNSIRLVLKDGRVNDAYALLRKFQDSAVINIYGKAFKKAAW